MKRASLFIPFLITSLIFCSGHCFGQPNCFDPSIDIFIVLDGDTLEDDNNVCLGSDVILRLSNCIGDTDGFTYEWTGDAGMITTNVQELPIPSVITDVPGAVTVQVSVDSGATVIATTEITFTVLEESEVDITLASAPSTLCSGQSFTLQANYTGGSGTAPNNVYDWTPSPTSQSGETAIYQGVEVGDANYQVTVTDTEGCTATSASTEFTVFELPNPVIDAAATVNLCAGDTLELELVGGADNLTCTWQNGLEEAPSTNCAVSIESVLVSDQGSYTVEVTDNNQCIAESNAVTVMVDSLSISITSPMEDVCTNGGPVELSLATNETPLTGNSVTISPISPDAIDFTPGSNEAIFSPTDLLPGDYVITYAGTFNACNETAAVTINVLEIPSAVINNLAPTDQFCAGQTMTLVSSAGDNLSCSWTKDGNDLVDETLCQLVRNPVSETDAGEYTLVVTDDSGNGCSSNPDTLNVQVDDLNVSITTTAPPNPNGICSNLNEVELILTPAQGVSDSDTLILDESFPVNALDGLVIDLGAASIGSPYVFTYNVELGACIESASTIINILDSPEAETFAIPPVCNQTSSIDLNDYVLPSGPGGVFTFTDNTEFDGILNPVDAEENDSLRFTYLYTDPVTGCKDSISNGIFIKPQLVVTIESDYELCVGAPGGLGAAVTGGDNTYTFSWSPGAQLDDENSQFPNLIDDIEVGEYNFNLTVEDDSLCSETAIQTVQIRQQPVVSVTSNLSGFCVGDSLLLTASTAGGVGTPDFFWEGDNSAQQSITFQTGPIFQAQNFTIVITFPDSTGCESDSAEPLFSPSPTPDPSILSARTSDDNSICNNEVSIYFAEDRRQDSELIWSLQGGNQNVDSVVSDDDLFYVYWADNPVGPETVTLMEKLGENCQALVQEQVTFSGSTAPPAAEVFLSTLNGILVYNQSGLCYRWGYIDPNANVNANPPESYLNFDLEENTFQSFIIGDLDTTLTYFCETWLPGNCDDVGGSCSTTIVYQPKNNNITQPPPKEKVGFAVFPNPNTGNFNFKIGDLIENRNYTWELRNPLGQIIDAGDFVPSGSDHTESLSIGNQAQGIYLLTISDGRQILKVSRVNIQN